MMTAGSAPSPVFDVFCSVSSAKERHEGLVPLQPLLVRPEIGTVPLYFPPEAVRVVEVLLMGEFVDDEVALDLRRRHHGSPVYRYVAEG